MSLAQLLNVYLYENQLEYNFKYFISDTGNKIPYLLSQILIIKTKYMQEFKSF